MDPFVLTGLINPSLSKTRKPYILYSDNKFKIIWDIIISIILMLACMMTPVNLAFSDMEENVAWYTLEIISDCLFLGDIFVNFISAYEEDEMVEIDDRKLIALNYLKGWFIIDVVAIFPLEAVIKVIQGTSESSTGVNSMVRIARIGKIYRLLKVTRLFRLFKMKQKEEKLVQ